MRASQEPGNGSMLEVARGLARAVEAALAAHGELPAEVREPTWRAAVDVAELLELPGLSALLAACAAHAEDPPLAVANVFERLARLARETESRGDLSVFLEADRELASLAGLLAAQDWGAPDALPGVEGAPVSLLPIAELLSELELDRPGARLDAQVSLPAATALRAALDWIGADERGAVRAQVHDAALELSVRPSHEPGLRAAGAVLASAGGALLSEPDGRWALRVPLHREQPAYLLARQGELALAIPWNAVARLRIADDAARMVMTEPALVPWSPLERPQGERPAALLAFGLTRAWLHLDHIVWRVFARPEPAETSAAVPGGGLVVRAEDGKSYDVVDVSDALAGVPPLDTPPPRPRPHPGPEPTLITRARVPAGSAPGPISGRPGVEGAAFESVEPAQGEPAVSDDVEVAPSVELVDELPGSDDVDVVVLETFEPIELFEPGEPAEPAAEPAPAPEAPARPTPSALIVLGPESVRPRMRTGPVPAPPATLGASAVTPRVATIREVADAHPAPAAPPESEPVALESAGPAPSEPAPAVPAPAEPAAAEPAPPETAPAEPRAVDEGRLRALIVDDSLVARIALGRALEREGWVVEWVERAEEMWRAIEDSPWTVVFVDVSLPDSSGGEHLQALADRVADAHGPFELVALTRDETEDQDAFASGIVRTLRKPFTPALLQRMVDALPMRGRS